MPEAMWVSARKQDSSLKVAVVHSWQWIRHFVTNQTVDWSHNCQGNDLDCVEKVRAMMYFKIILPIFNSLLLLSPIVCRNPYTRDPSVVFPSS